MRIALLGTGLMGSRMAKRLLDADFDLSVWNRSAEKLTPLGAAGAHVASTPGHAASGRDLIITMLSDAEAVETVLFGPNGAFDEIGDEPLVVDMSSLTPKIACEHAEKALERGARYLDAPVSGGIAGAEAGTLSIMVGGDAAVFEAALPVLSQMGTPFLLGGIGAGQACKLVNQLIVHIYIGAVSEGLLLASSLGADPAKVRDAISGGFCQSRILELHGRRMVDRDFVPGGPAKFALKDLRSADALATDLGLSLPLTQQILSLYKKMNEDGLGDYDHSAALKVLEHMNVPHRVTNKPDQVPD